MTRAARRHGSRSSLCESDNGTTSVSLSAAMRDFSPTQPSSATSGLSGGQAPALCSSLLDSKTNSRSQHPNGSKSSRFAGKSASKSSTHDYVFPPATIDRWQFQKRTADELQRLAKKFRYGSKSRKSFIRKAKALSACGVRTQVKACVHCGAARSGSGVQSSPGHPCSLRICPFCQHTQSERCVAELSPIVSQLIHSSSLPERKGYAFWSGTLTATYDPKDPNDLSIEALRERALGLQASIYHVFNKARKNASGRTPRCPDAALAYGIEIGKSGNVHMHFVCYDLPISQAEFEKAAREVYPDAGFSSLREIYGHTKAITSKNRAHVERAVGEALRYTIKAPSPLDENWFDVPREVIQPELAARWEIATRGLHLRNRLGAFRRKASVLDDSASTGNDSVTSDPSELACCNCGSCIGYQTQQVDTRTWVARCHSRGQRTFGTSRVGPSPKQAPANTSTLRKSETTAQRPSAALNRPDQSRKTHRRPSSPR